MSALRVAFGFTLIELLIVVVILSTLAAIVVPGFSNVRNSSTNSSIASTISVTQQAIDRYHADHGFYPAGGEWWKGCPGINLDHLGRVEIGGIVMNRLIAYSNSNGVVCDSRQDTAGDSYSFGPYLNKDVQVNPLTGSHYIKVISTEQSIPNNQSVYGWIYYIESGRFESAAP